MNKREAKAGLKFRHWLKANPMQSALYELKHANGHSLPFNAVKEHQVDALLAAKSKDGLLYKPQDMTYAPIPADYFYLRNSFGWVVIFYEGFFVIIDIDAFLIEKEHSKRKSLTSMRARDIAWVSVKC